jgi:hypothetical protein
VAAIAALAGGLVAAAPAQAKLLEIYVQGGVGGGGGEGLTGDHEDADFFKGAGGPGYGAILGAEIFFIDVAVEHDQFVQDGGVSGTWTQFSVGADVDVELGKNFTMNLGGSIGYGLGTGQQVMPPLDNSEITDKGLIAQGRVDLDYALGSMVSLGITVPLTWGYLAKNTAGTVVNDESATYTSLSSTPMLYLRLRFEPFASKAKDGGGDGAPAGSQE